jgi:MarR family transcriptional regulator, organic hydroperoxide resistance regulator
MEIPVSGARTLQQTEEAMSGKVADLDLDMDAMTAISNLYRVASAVRNHFEQSVLKDADLTWTAFVVLWVVWIWESMETRHVAAEAGITKGTLTGVAQTLEARGLLVREISPADRRRTFLTLTDKGERLMAELFPAFNREERFVVGGLSERRVKELGSSLRRVLTHLEAAGPQRQAEVLEASAGQFASDTPRRRPRGRSNSR